MNRFTLSIVLFSLLFTHDTSAQNKSSKAEIDGVSSGYLVPHSYENAKELGNMMSISQLLELKSKLIKLTEKQSYENEDEAFLIDYSHSIVANGLYQKNTKYAEEMIDEVRNNLLIFYHARGDNNWDQTDKNDLILYKKFALFINLLEDILYTSMREKNYTFCMHILKKNHAIPFIVVRSMVTKYLVTIYNEEGLSPIIKDEAEKLFTLLIDIEKEAVKVDTGQDDFIFSRIDSESLLKILHEKKVKKDSHIIVIP